MILLRRQLLKSLVAASLLPAIRRIDRSSLPPSRLLHGLNGEPDWLAVRDLFPLAPDWTHLSSFLFVSHPLTLHTPRDPALSGGISCFEVRGMTPGQVVARLAEKKVRTTTSPYKVSYARVSAGIMNKPEEVELVLREIRALAA